MTEKNIKLKKSLFGYDKESVIKFYKELISNQNSLENDLKSTISILEDKVNELQLENQSLRTSLCSLKSFEEKYIKKSIYISDLITDVKLFKDEEIKKLQEESKNIIDNMNLEINKLKEQKNTLEKQLINYKKSIFNNMKNDLINKQSHIESIIYDIDKSIKDIDDGIDICDTNTIS